MADTTTPLLASDADQPIQQLLPEAYIPEVLSTAGVNSQGEVDDVNTDVAALSAGQSVTKFSAKAGKPAKCQIKLSSKRDALTVGSKTLTFSRGDLQSISLGPCTPTFRTVMTEDMKSQGESSLDPALCFSLCNDVRSWDLQAETAAQRVAIVSAVQQCALESGTYQGIVLSRQDIIDHLAAESGGLAAAESGVDGEAVLAVAASSSQGGSLGCATPLLAAAVANVEPEMAPKTAHSFCQGCGAKSAAENKYCLQCGSIKSNDQPQQALPQPSEPASVEEYVVVV
jgi:hypothetical protein